MTLTAEHLQLLGDIYDAAIDPTRWPALLDRLAIAHGAVGAALHAIDAIDRTVFSVQEFSSFFSPELVNEYLTTYAKYEGNAWDLMFTKPVGSIVTDEDLWPDREAFATRPDVVWARDEVGYFHRAAAKLSDERAWFDAIAFQYGTDRGNITQEERAIARQFAPHLGRAISMFRGFTVLKSRFNAVLGALDHFHMGLFLVSGSGAVVLSNKTAQEVLDRRDSIAVGRSGQLSLLDPTQTSQLHNAIQAAAATARAEETVATRMFRVPSRSGDTAYLIEVSPLRDTDREIDSTFKGALVSVIDPDVRWAVSTRGIKELYGLTDAEADVARLVIDGNTANEIAEIRSVSPQTVRNQTKSLFEKMDCGNRVDLVRRAMIVNLPIDDAE